MPNGSLDKILHTVKTDVYSFRVLVLEMLQGGLVPDLPATKPTVMIRSVNFDRSPEVVVRCGVDEGLAAKSLYFTISYVMFYTEKRKYLLAASEEIFSNVAKGVLRVRANHLLFFVFPLKDVSPQESNACHKASTLNDIKFCKWTSYFMASKVTSVF
ncbi:hypothetical protein L2E82_21342 [Cichorium intybus]|uniref:Uncharacterized protein n=1 Tax=Cichorium intybus TaxID=13427 RepID=A0ACB9DW02_CICIN|nr:hypothetical protein L2E82_21342 [Cichorium intybus]